MKFMRELYFEDWRFCGIFVGTFFFAFLHMTEILGTNFCDFLFSTVEPRYNEPPAITNPLL